MKDIYVGRFSGKVISSPSPACITIQVDDNFDCEKVIEVQQGEKQKTDDKGNLLYLDKNKLNVQDNPTETADSRDVTKTEDKQVTNKWVDDKGVEQSKTITVQEPVECYDNEPVMIPNMVDTIIKYSTNPQEFTLDEILEAKYKTILENSQEDNIIADMFIEESDIDLTNKDHKANTGIGIMELLPNGQVVTKSISLAKSTSIFTLLEFNTDAGVDICINNTRFVNGTITLASAVDNVTIKFVNTTNMHKVIKSYAIGY
ncbi:hypothetical protein [Clostridium sp. AWRP]|uniref:hypothetical protein n=1 Tax=Clostridium sp. AWRP TaxID=2212991 RepID=UPI000FD94D1D|nr:hypothetical protein [Clostridium sp. AWRP]AZV57912.1 hypothetical protein DMR38_15580 [Clostridium sp. AWRP]